MFRVPKSLSHGMALRVSSSVDVRHLYTYLGAHINIHLASVFHV